MIVQWQYRMCRQVEDEVWVGCSARCSEYMGVVVWRGLACRYEKGGPIESLHHSSVHDHGACKLKEVANRRYGTNG
jgi:hypothetical protein